MANTTGAEIKEDRSGSLKRAGYTALVDRIEAAKNSAKVLCSEAHQADDQETEWLARACLADLERTEAKLKGSAV